MDYNIEISDQPSQPVLDVYKRQMLLKAEKPRQYYWIPNRMKK